MGLTTPLHRDDPTKAPLVGNVKVTRQDWLNAAMDVLITDGVESVKILALADHLNVSRSSFYWYFKDRADLLNALLDHWESTNTAALVAQSNAPAKTVTAAVCNVFRCVVNPALFDISLDFAVRDWARRSSDVRDVLLRSDARRISALQAMFGRYGYKETDALIRARVLYYMQNGYNDADLKEPIEERMRILPHYLFAFTGVQPQAQEIEEFREYSIRVQNGGPT
ncbi:MAG: TetR/AcrR family transcriptional regulator [Boseongicola sp.]